MHELSVTEHILNIAIKHAKENNATRVTDIYLTIGQLSSIIDDSIQFYWDIISANTICTGAKIHFDRIPAQLRCMECNNEFTLDNGLRLCPSCNSAFIKVIAGEEFYVDSIAIEKDQH